MQMDIYYKKKKIKKKKCALIPIPTITAVFLAVMAHAITAVFLAVMAAPAPVQPPATKREV